MDALQQIGDTIVDVLPTLGWALLILVAGFIIAQLVSAAVRRILKSTSIDDRIAKSIGGQDAGINIENIIGKIVFYLIMLMTVIAAAQALNLTIVTEPLNQMLTTVFNYLPKIAGAAFWLGVAWVVATAVKMLITRVLSATTLDDRFNHYVSDDAESNVAIGPALGEAAYWLILLLFLPGVLSALNIDGMQPIQNMVDSILGFIPNLFGAAIILAIGWFVARLVQKIVSGFLAAFGVDSFGERLGLNSVLGSQKLSDLIGMIAYIFVFLPVLIGALEALKLQQLTAPVSNMLDSVLSAIPAIFGAALILIASFVIGRVVSNLLATMLEGVGFDNITNRLGLSNMMDEGGRTPSQFVGYLILLGIMLFAGIEAANILGFDMVADLVAQITTFVGRVLLGVIILGIGLYIANFAADMVRSSNVSNAGTLATITRVAVLVLTGAMGLRQMGLANEIINMAFGLLLGSVAVAGAIAFGLGGWRPAGRMVEKWMHSLDSGDRS